ncbi:MAG: potassium-transporting ATPase subunit C [Acidimicrobiales bacterium]
MLTLRRAVVVSIFFAVLLGLAYPLAETGIAQGLFHHQANGSLGANGSSLIGQRWKGPEWFQGRPDPDNAMASGPANLGPRSAALEKQVAALVAAYRAEGVAPTPDLVTGSGSGLDPDITPAGAYAQVDAVAKARGLAPRVVRALVGANIKGSQLGFLGNPYVNVLALNEALARAAACPLAAR